MPTADYLADRLTELRQAAVAALTVARTGNAAPSRIYRSHGPPAVDTCEGDGLLVVYLDSPALELAKVTLGRGAQADVHRYMPVCRLVVEVWRCVPVVTEAGAPTVGALDGAAEDLARDGHALWTGLHLAREAGTLFPAADENIDVTLGDPVPLPPQGGAAGWRMRVTLPLTRHEPPAL